VGWIYSANGLYHFASICLVALKRCNDQPHWYGFNNLYRLIASFVCGAQLASSCQGSKTVFTDPWSWLLGSEMLQTTTGRNVNFTQCPRCRIERVLKAYSFDDSWSSFFSDLFWMKNSGMSMVCSWSHAQGSYVNSSLCLGHSIVQVQTYSLGRLHCRNFSSWSCYNHFICLYYYFIQEHLRKTGWVPH
jgi:hypothetical protein